MSCNSTLFKSVLNFSKFSGYTQVRNKVFTKFSPNAELSKGIIDRYKKLKIPSSKVPATYLWIDGSGERIRGKTRTLDFKPKCAEELPQWYFNGSAVGLSTVEDSDTLMRPVAMYKNPFIKGGVLVLCDTYKSNGEPTATNHRLCCLDAIDQICDKKPWFGMEQEFILMTMYGEPFPFAPGLKPIHKGTHYCGVGGNIAFGRAIIESFYHAMLFMDVNIAGTNAEKLPGQWEFQIGPSEGIDCADELWVARYVLHRIAEEYGVAITLDPKPSRYLSGSGLHTSFSTEDTRKDNGIQEIEKAIEKLKAKHPRHIAAYDPKKGEDNKRRLTGKNQTANIKEFTSGVANRGASVRIPRHCAKANKGYLEDRRPASNGDPYSIMNVIVRTCFLDQ